MGFFFRNGGSRKIDYFFLIDLKSLVKRTLSGSNFSNSFNADLFFRSSTPFRSGWDYRIWSNWSERANHDDAVHQRSVFWRAGHWGRGRRRRWPRSGVQRRRVDDSSDQRWPSFWVDRRFTLCRCFVGWLKSRTPNSTGLISSKFLITNFRKNIQSTESQF